MVHGVHNASAGARGLEREPQTGASQPDLFELLLGAELAREESGHETAEDAGAETPPAPETEHPQAGVAGETELLDPRLAIAAQALAEREGAETSSPEAAASDVGGSRLANPAVLPPQALETGLQRSAAPELTPAAPLRNAPAGVEIPVVRTDVRAPAPDPEATSPMPAGSPPSPEAPAEAMLRQGSQDATARSERVENLRLAPPVLETGPPRAGESSASAPPTPPFAMDSEGVPVARSAAPSEELQRAAAQRAESADRPQPAGPEAPRPANPLTALADARAASSDDPGRDDGHPSHAPDRSLRPVPLEHPDARNRPTEAAPESVIPRTPPADAGDRSAPPVPFDAVSRPANAAPPGAAPPSNPAPTTPAAALQEPIEWLLTRGGGSARIRLHPPHLGEVDLRVSLRNGAIHVQVVAHERVAHSVLEASRDVLVQSLAARDIRVDGFQVSTAPQGDPDDGSDSRAGGSGGRSDAEEHGASLGGGERGRSGTSLAGSNVAAGASATLEAATRPQAGGIDLRV